ncbi:MAG TPA: ATPase, T2SS/T4P/T4SS family, partial [Oligoflexia bacterium]|nr:ATPase, T2SS/T4P/T4SS family [Oligoflexia bacterium]
MSSHVGELLVQNGLIDKAQLEQAVQLAKSNGGLINSAVVKLGYIEEAELVALLSRQYGLPVVQLDEYQIEPRVVSLVPQALAIKHHLLPLELNGTTLTTAMVDPSNITAFNDIKFITGYDIRVVLAAEADIKKHIEKFYDSDISYDNLFRGMDEDDVEILSNAEEVDLNALEKATEDAPVVKLVNAILTDAIKKGASDIHLEPYEKTFRVRFRIDGVLYEIMKPPYKLKNAIISRIKIMADLDIAERRLPQDGRIKLKLGNRREMDFRVSVLPSLFGEKVVLRLLDKSTLQTDMTKLGFDEQQLQVFKEAIDKPFGMV